MKFTILLALAMFTMGFYLGKTEPSPQSFTQSDIETLMLIGEYKSVEALDSYIESRPECYRGMYREALESLTERGMLKVVDGRYLILRGDWGLPKRGALGSQEGDGG